MAMKERRKFARKKIPIKIEYLLPTQDIGAVSRSQDVSLGGLCLPIIYKVKPKTKLSLKIYLAVFKRPIKATGKVAWSKKAKKPKKNRPFLAGIKFIKIDPADLRKINKYIKLIEKIEIEAQK